MTSISECPVTERAWNQRSVDKGCSPQNNYHCVRTQDDGVLELCTYPVWIQAGKCPIYNRARTLDSSYCKPRRSFKCPTNAYTSNQVFNYPSCFPEKSAIEREVTTEYSLPTSSYQLSTTTNNVSDDSGGKNSALAALILILPIVLAIVIFWKRRQIRQWIQNVNTRRHTEINKTESTVLRPVNETAQTFDNIEQGKREIDKLITNDTTCEKIKEQTDTQSELKLNALHPRKVRGPASTRIENVQDVERKTSKSTSSAVIENQRSKTTRNLMHLDIPTLSFVDKIAEALSTKQIVIITGLPGSGKSELAHQVLTSTCQLFTDGANVSPIDDFSQLEWLDVDKITFLLLDHCIKSWFSKTIIDNTLRKLKTAIKKGKGKVHALLCVPDIILEDFKLLIKSNSLKHELYCLNDHKIYTDEDWKAIFDCHLRSKNEMIKNLGYQESDIDAWRKNFIEIKATRIGKPAMAKLLFEDIKNLQNVSDFLHNTYESLWQRISALSESNCETERCHFVVIVVVMLNNGKMSIDDLNNDMLIDICKSFNVEDTALFENVEYAELEQNAETVSMHCRETVRVAFDVLWKKRKDLWIKYCNEQLFLELVSLTDEMTESELIAINERFQLMILSGKSFVKDHCILAKCSRAIQHLKGAKLNLNA